MSDREFPLEIEQLAQSLSSIRKVLDFDAMEREIATLQEEAGDPNLWNDQENAARVTSKLARLQNEIERIEKLVSRVDDVRVLVELAESENDAGTLAEALLIPPMISERWEKNLHTPNFLIGLQPTSVIMVNPLNAFIE